MTDEMKLLTALCEALGFRVEVDQIKEYQPFREHRHFDGWEMKDGEYMGYFLTKEYRVVKGEGNEQAN